MHKQGYLIIFLSILMLSTGCKTLPTGQEAPVVEGLSIEGQDWQTFYLSIRTMDEQSLRHELTHQKMMQSQGSIIAGFYLALLYGYPGTAVSSPSLARQELLSLQDNPAIKDQGAISLLLDQLETRLTLQAGIAEVQAELNRHNQQLSKAKRDNQWLQEQKNALERQLQQLKAIEQNILKREVVGNGN